MFFKSDMVMQKIDKIEALKTLLKMEQEGFDLYQIEKADMYGGGRIHEVRLLEPLEHYKREDFNREKALNDVLRRMLSADIPKDIEHIEEERQIVKLVLMAGANPNAYSRHYAGKRIFDAFFNTGRSYAALEVAKSPNFSASGDLESIYECLSDYFDYYLKHGYHFPGKTEKEDEMNRYKLKDRKELLHVLFGKGMYPYDEKLFKKLTPIILEQDPHFFEQKKEKTMMRLSRAKSPIQIFKAIRGERERK